MFIGHYSTAFLARRIAPALPLPVWFIASQLIDLSWSVLVLADIEKLRVIPGFTASNGLDLYFMPYTHSLPAALLWGMAAALVTWLYMRPGTQRVRTAAAVGMVVASHWVLDLLVHVPDLPLWFDGAKAGLGWWNYRIFALLLELALLWAAVLLCMQSPGVKRRRYLLLGAAMSIVQFSSAMLQPADGDTLALQLLAVFIALAGCAHWADRRPAGYAGVTAETTSAA